MTVPPTVVLVDDSDDLRMLVRYQVERAGRFRVLGEGASGHDAISLAGLHHPDLMLLDVSMPGMDGLEALPQVREISPQTKVVMFTGFVQQGLGDRARQLGATALLEKSMSIRTLPDQLSLLVTESEPSILDQGPVSAATPTDANPTVLQEHQERFREVFDEAAIGMGTMTLAGHLVRANKAMAAMVARDSDQLVGISYEAMLPVTERRAFDEVLSRALDDNVDVIQFEHGLLGLPEQRQMITTLAPIRDSQHAPLYLFAQLQDVSGQRAAESALQLSEERFKLLVDTVTDYAIFMLGPDGLVQSWNAGAQRLKGYTAEEVIGTHFRRFYPEHLKQVGHPEHELRLALRDGHYEEEGWRVRKDGSQFWANVVITAIHDQSGIHIGFAKITRDVTERRRMLVEKEASADALARSNAELGQANTELGIANRQLSKTAEDQAQFLAIIAHELRTPITVIAGTAEMLRDDVPIDDDQSRRLLDGMVVQTARLRRLLDDLLTAARLDAQAMTLEPRPIRLAGVLVGCVEAARRRYPGKQIQLDPVADDLTVYADDERLGQIVDNLINNAMNHGEPPVRVSTALVGDWVEFRVTDSGVGVPAEVRERLFDRYVTAARSGTGLGLYIVRELARAHGGNAWYENGGIKPTFVVSLPRPLT